MANTATPLSCKAAVKDRQRKRVLDGRHVNIIKNKPKPGGRQGTSTPAAMSKGGKKPTITAISSKPEPATGHETSAPAAEVKGGKKPAMGARPKRIRKDRLKGKGDAKQGQKGKRGGRRQNGTKRGGSRPKGAKRGGGRGSEGKQRGFCFFRKWLFPWWFSSLKNVKMSWNEEEQAFVQKS